jgi:hypothetical protein
LKIEHIHHLVDEKKWTQLLREIAQCISDVPCSSDYELLIYAFESIDKKFKEQHARVYYLDMWKVAFNLGKIKLAKSYAEFAILYLAELKRIPQLKKLFQDLHDHKFFKTHPMVTYPDFLLGRGGDVATFSDVDPTHLELHPDLWKNSKVILKEYLITENEWTVTHWKLAYEFILKFYFDKELFFQLTEKAIASENSKHKRKLLLLLERKNIKFQSKVKAQSKSVEKVEESNSLHVDYDQLAMDVMSGEVEPSVTEQRKILHSLENLSADEVMTKGKDMVVAFGLLGMDKVVVNLCERIIPSISDVHERASLQFMMAQSLFNSGDYYKTIDLVDDISSVEPLLREELVAFQYLKAESFMKLKMYKNAKEIFLLIKKYNSYYRLVSERLRQIETT